jgi:hypothetical protein
MEHRGLVLKQTSISNSLDTRYQNGKKSRRAKIMIYAQSA